MNGQLNYDVTDLFYVSNGRITKIVDFSSDNSLGHAIELYSQRKYDEAFKLFRKLAYERYTNFDAQYYTVVMELKGQGCKYMSKKFRDTEIAWFITRNTLAGREDAVKLAMSFVLDETKLDIIHYGDKWYDHMIRICQPAASGRTVVFDKKSITVGVIDERGKQIVPFGKYDAVYPYHDGRALVRSKTTKMWGYIDENGREAIPLIYEDGCLEFHRGRVFCYKDDTVYLVDAEGKVLKTLYGYKLMALVPSCAKYVMLNNGSGADIFDYDGNLYKEGIVSFETNYALGNIHAVSKDDAVDYRIEW